MPSEEALSLRDREREWLVNFIAQTFSSDMVNALNGFIEAIKRDARGLRARLQCHHESRFAMVEFCPKCELVLSDISRIGIPADSAQAHATDAQHAKAAIERAFGVWCRDEKPDYVTLCVVSSFVQWAAQRATIG